MRSRLLWVFKQMFPLSYKSEFISKAELGELGKRQLCIWRMWLGKCYDVQWYDLAA